MTESFHKLAKELNAAIVDVEIRPERYYILEVSSVSDDFIPELLKIKNQPNAIYRDESKVLLFYSRRDQSHYGNGKISRIISNISAEYMRITNTETIVKIMTFKVRSQMCLCALVASSMSRIEHIQKEHGIDSTILTTEELEAKGISREEGRGVIYKLENGSLNEMTMISDSRKNDDVIEYIFS